MMMMMMMVSMLSSLMPAASDGELPGFHFGHDHTDGELPMFSRPFTPHLQTFVLGAFAHFFRAPNGLHHHHLENLDVAVLADFTLQGLRNLNHRCLFHSVKELLG